MTSPGHVIDTAFVEIRPTAAPGFERDLERQVDTPATRMAARLGDKVGAAVGKGISFAMNSRVQAGIGAAGVLLQKFADDQTRAQGQLAAAISSTGGQVEDYQSRIDAAVKSNERLGLSQDKTKSELTELTLALGSPAKALQELSIAQDIAAGTGKSFTTVVNLLRLANEGSVSGFAQLGLKVQDVTKAQSALNAAQSASARATDTVSKAQQSFNDKLAIYRQDTTHTLAQQLELYHSHQNLVKAQEAAAAAAAKVTAAQKNARSATSSQKQAVQELAEKYKGQASQGADTFSGHLKALGAEAKDTAGTIVAKYGNAAGGVGFALLGVSQVTKVVRSAFKAMRDVEITTSAEASAAIVADAAAADAALLTEAGTAEAAGGRIAAALAKLGGVGVIGGLGSLLLTGGDAPSLKQSDIAKTILGVREKQGNDDGLALFDKALKLKKGQPFVQSRGVDKDAALTFLLTYGDPNDPKVAAALSALGYHFTPADPRNSDNPNAATHAQNGTKVTAAGKTLGKAAAKATGDSFADFLKKYGLGDAVNQALSDAHDKAVAAAQKLVDDVASRLDAAKSKLQSDVLASKQLQLQIAQTVSQGSALADAFADRQSNVRNGLGDRPIAGQGGLKGVESFLHQRAVMIARFAKALTNLRKKGLDQRLIDEIAQLGTDQGLPIAEQILAGSSADVRSINTSEQQIARAANTVGQRFANNQYGDLIAADKANADALIRKLEELKAQLVRISRNPSAVNVDVKQTGASAKEVGQVVGTTIRQAMKGMS